MLNVYSLEETEKWDEVVHSFAQSDVYYLSGYVKAFALHGDGEPMLFYYENDSVRGINVVMKRDIASDERFVDKIAANTYFDFSTPYGYGGWLIEGEGNTTELFDEYSSWCRDNSIISEFVRFHPVLKNHIFSENDYDVIPLGETIAMDLSSPKVIWDNITSKNRNVIRKAIKSGVKIYNGRSHELFRTFKTIYDKTMDKDNAEEYYYFKDEFYNSILEDLPNNAQIFYAQLDDGTVISSAIIIGKNNKLNYHLSGSRRDYQHLAPSNLLLYHVALWGCENGYKSFYLGGGVGSAEDSLFKFKRSFYRGDLFRFHIGKKIFNKQVYDELVDLRSEVRESSFFPCYRA